MLAPRAAPGIARSQQGCSVVEALDAWLPINKNPAFIEGGVFTESGYRL
jgi:hypothetical protein